MTKKADEERRVKAETARSLSNIEEQVKGGLPTGWQLFPYLLQHIRTGWCSCDGHGNCFQQLLTYALRT
jgi:hypothetical protein